MIYFLTTCGLAAASIRRNDGHLVYCIDDAYIHLATARSLALHGVWGVSPHAFSSASSSPLWTVLLAAGIRLLGLRNWLPLALNLLSGLAVLEGSRRLLAVRGVPGPVALAVLCGLTLLLPLPYLALLGMEHTLELALALLFVLSLERFRNEDNRWSLYPAAACMVACRYETIALVAGALVVLACRRHWSTAAWLLPVALVPVAGFGLYFHAHVGLWLPASVLLKSDFSSVGHGLPGLARVVWFRWTRLHLNRTTLPLYLSLPAGAVLLAGARPRPGPEGSRAMDLLALLLTATALHLSFIPQDGGAYRYDAYLLGLFLVMTAPAFWNSFQEVRPKRTVSARKHRFFPGWAVTVGAGFVLLQAVSAQRLLANTVQSTVNIYGQQFQMGRFVRRFYPGGSVALNDIGAVNYLAEIRCTDLVGLGDTGMARLRLGSGLIRPTFSALVDRRAIRLAILYEGRYEWLFPAGWTRAGEWRISNNIVCGNERVAFFAPEPVSARKLAEQLREFAPELPAGVTWRLDPALEVAAPAQEPLRRK